VTIIDRRQPLADKAWHRLNKVPLMRYGDLLSTDANIDEIVDQPTGDGIRVGSNANCAAATDFHTEHQVVGVELFRRQPIQMCQIVPVLLLPIAVSTCDQLLHELNVLFAALEVATAAQQ
jgi:hypothetical protein